MRKKGLIFFSLSVALLFFVVSLSPLTARAQINEPSVGKSSATFVVPPQPCSILLVEDPSPYAGEGKMALDNFGYSYTQVTASQVSSVNLYDYQVIFVAWMPTQAIVDALNGIAGNLAAWIKSGHGIVVNAEWKDGSLQNPYSFLPVTFDTASSVSHTNGVHIVDTAHPLAAGLTDALLDNWGNAVHSQITVTPDLTDPDISLYSVVSKATASDTPHVVGMCYGKGKIVVAATDPEYHVVYGPGDGPWQLLYNELSWASQPCCADPIEVLESKLDMIEAKLDRLPELYKLIIELHSAIAVIERKNDVIEAKLDKMQNLHREISMIEAKNDKMEVKLDGLGKESSSVKLLLKQLGYAVGMVESKLDRPSAPIR